MAPPALVTPDSKFGGSFISHSVPKHAATLSGETTPKEFYAATDTSGVESSDISSNVPGTFASGPVSDVLDAPHQIILSLCPDSRHTPAPKEREPIQELYTQVTSPDATSNGADIVHQPDIPDGRVTHSVARAHISSYPTSTLLVTSNSWVPLASHKSLGAQLDGASDGRANSSRSGASNRVLVDGGSCNSPLIVGTSGRVPMASSIAGPSFKPSARDLKLAPPSNSTCHILAPTLGSVSVFRDRENICARASLTDRLHSLVHTTSQPPHARRGPFPVSSSRDTFVVGEDSEEEVDGPSLLITPFRMQKPSLPFGVAICRYSSGPYIPPVRGIDALSRRGLFDSVPTVSSTFKVSINPPALGLSARTVSRP